MTLPTTLGIRIAWKNQNDFEQGFRIYRSETDFDESNLPPVLAEVPPGTEVYVDETANPEGTYYYLVSTFYKAKEVFAIATIKAKAYAGPLTLGEFYQGGYYIGNIVVAEIGRASCRERRRI